MCSSDLTAVGALANHVTDPDDQVLAFTVEGGGTYGSLALDTSTGDWTYTLNNSDADTQALNAGETALEVYTYTVTDGAGGTASATVTVTITGADDNPTAASEHGQTVIEAGVPGNGTPVATGTLADNVSDVDNGGAIPDDLDFKVSGGGVFGALTLDTETGSWTYTLNNSDGDTQILNVGQTATDTFTYTVIDESGRTATSTLVVTVVGENDAPLASNEAGGPVEANSGGAATGTLTDNVTDIDNEIGRAHV